MTSRPFNTSTKNPTSVKLRGLQTSKAVTRQLEVDSRRMEDRLKELKLAMNREKEERESRGSSSLGIWASGQPGAVTTQYANDVIKKKPKNSPALPGQKPKSGTKGRKIKVLKDTPIEVPQRPKFKLGLPGGDTQRNFKGPACGQCEEKAVALTCMECGENYCTGCFAKFHMKGALKNHRSVPYRSPTSSSESLPVPYENGYDDSRSLAIRPPNGSKSTTGTESHSPRQEKEKVVRVTLKSPPTSTGGSLLQGDYNEAESASSFAAALAEWRQGKKTEGGVQAAPGTPRGTTTSTSEGTSTSNGDISPRDIEIKFTETSSLSYADRLLLKKHRRTEIPPGGSPNLMGKVGVAKDDKQKENVMRKSLVNGEINFKDDVDLEDEHQRYANIFTKNSSPEAQEPRPESSLTISEVTEEDEKNIEESSTYSVQEEAMQSEQPHDMQLSSKQRNPQSERTTSEERIQSTNTKPSDSNSLSKKSSVNKSPAATSMKATKETSRAQSRSSKPRTPQSAANSKDTDGKNSAARPSSRTTAKVETKSGKSSAALRPTSRTSGSKVDAAGSSSAKVRSSSRTSASKAHAAVTGNSSATVRPSSKASRGKSAVCNTTERPVSAGLTTKPSQGLMQVSHHQQQPQHQYKEGLGEFFTVGLTGEESPESTEQTNNSATRSSVTPTNELPECTFQGNSIWRPDSSLAASSSDEAMQIPYTPSPPSRSSSRQSSATRSAQKTRQVKSPIKQILRNPETGSPIPENGDACNKRSSQGTSGLALRDFSSRASDRGLPDRSASRIEVEGDDMTGYDEDVVLTHREMTADDKETLEQLTWELASQEGRITADGRITSMSILEEENENEDFGRFSHDAELGILQDDGHGSGLSTPCEITMERDGFSEEDLQADFEDNEMCKEEVEALR